MNEPPPVRRERVQKEAPPGALARRCCRQPLRPRVCQPASQPASRCGSVARRRRCVAAGMRRRCQLALLCVLLLCAATPASTKKGRKARQKAKQQLSFDYLDPKVATQPAPKGDRARLSSRYSLGSAEPDPVPMMVQPDLMSRWDEARVPSKMPDAARGSADPLNLQSARKQGSRLKALQGNWLLADQLPPEAEVETLIDDPITGTRIATISHFINATEIARLIELVDLAPTWPQKRLSLDQRRLRGYRYTYVGANEDAIVAAVEDRMAAVTSLPSHARESRLMVSEYLALPQSHPYFPLNNIHLDIDVKPDRVATFILCACHRLSLSFQSSAHAPRFDNAALRRPERRRCWRRDIISPATRQGRLARLLP